MCFMGVGGGGGGDIINTVVVFSAGGIGSLVPAPNALQVEGSGTLLHFLGLYDMASCNF